jgi:hypothetical protein
MAAYAENGKADWLSRGASPNTGRRLKDPVGHLVGHLDFDLTADTRNYLVLLSGRRGTRTPDTRLVRAVL